MAKQSALGYRRQRKDRAKSSPKQRRRDRSKKVEERRKSFCHQKGEARVKRFALGKFKARCVLNNSGRRKGPFGGTVVPSKATKLQLQDVEKKRRQTKQKSHDYPWARRCLASYFYRRGKKGAVDKSNHESGTGKNSRGSGKEGRKGNTTGEGVQCSFDKRAVLGQKRSGCSKKK